MLNSEIATQPSEINAPQQPQVSLDRALELGPNTLLNSKQLAQILGNSTVTLAQWRQKGYGPAFVRVSRSHVAYRAGDIAEFLKMRLNAA